ncbi:adaptor protein MecA [Priestia taiwanensis]|uniref:Adapter protein MecA n=1 Tax=Priestia taiwanensis TaxID=1347902 RepID=A0A917AUQ4_9BACI|nr:adaptor protein MecA [Priestia taiwanensis]MBM7364148.1 adapter protein MecA 1/2 [Priestia taiwanensis]GGE72011.1 adapter protein MecA 1 [Priestia taiwanensis]
MDIERINEHTVKFYISYMDIEKRGFDQDDLWYNREKSEQLFWEIMDDLSLEEEFMPEGPLWVQVQALEEGIEVVVTQAQLSKDGQKLELPVGTDKVIDVPIDERMEALFEQHFGTLDEELAKVSNVQEEPYSFVYRFDDIEHIISLSHRLELESVINSLHVFEKRYYLYVEFDEELHGEEDIDGILSVISEYGSESTITIHRIEEYGKVIALDNALHVFQKSFSLRS